MPETLGDQYPIQLNRCRELLKQYEEIGPSGVYGAAVIRDTIARAEKAQADGDTVLMIRCFKEMELRQ